MRERSMQKAEVSQDFEPIKSVSVWLTVGFAYVVLAIPGLNHFSSDIFAFTFGARMALAGAAVAIGLAQLIGIVLADSLLAKLFFVAAFAIEAACSLRLGVLQPGLGLLSIIAVIAPIIQKRLHRMDLDSSAEVIKRITDRISKQLVDLQLLISNRQATASVSTESQEMNMIAFPNKETKQLKTTTHVLEYSETAPETAKGPMMSLSAIADVCDSVIAEKTVQLRNVKKVSLVFVRPEVLRQDVAALADAKDLKRVLNAAVDLAVRSIGGTEGLIRFTISSNLRDVVVGVEDNGYGMSEERLAVAGGPTLFNYAQIRGLVAFWGGRVVRQARLGVGSRVLIELPRVDAFARDSVVNQKNPRIDQLSPHE